MTDSSNQDNVSWTLFDQAGESYEWVAVPQKDGTTVMILRRLGSEKSFGVIIGPKAKASTEAAQDAVDEFKEHL